MNFIAKSLTSKTVYGTVPPYNINWMVDQKFMRTFLSDNPITIVDVGARGGSCEELSPLMDYINYIGFDADREESDRLNSTSNPGYNKYEILPFFVGSHPGPTKFNLYTHPGDSSQLEQPPNFANILKTVSR